ncbi:MAG: type II toxin-antitoxin system Phd/YefM family antitoxin [Bacteroidetes bacterium]|nr:type II toxin-antitoxin system Phd/YefM family antitoxin [Bacteroidota bacterium]MBS1540333.1 type II toxin-antitoxin system Phd/YefM family antitoxin [Bacteroidota bacterium]
METVNIHKAKTTLSSLIERTLKGEKIIIARNGKPLVTLSKIKKTGKRVGGKYKGQIWIAPDFDKTPTEFNKYIK